MPEIRCRELVDYWMHFGSGKHGRALLAAARRMPGRGAAHGWVLIALGTAIVLARHFVHDAGGRHWRKRKRSLVTAFRPLQCTENIYAPLK